MTEVTHPIVEKNEKEELKLQENPTAQKYIEEK
jgi:hypothetical protein